MSDAIGGSEPAPRTLQRGTMTPARTPQAATSAPSQPSSPSDDHVHAEVKLGKAGHIALTVIGDAWDLGNAYGGAVFARDTSEPG